MARNMNTRSAMLIAIISLVGIGVLAAQEQDAMQQKNEYNALIRKETTLKTSLDSIQNLLKENRTIFENEGQQNDSLSEEIIRLEGEIYDIRGQLNRIGSQLVTLEAQLAKLNIQTNNNTGVATSQKKNFLQNTFFTTNLSAKDRELFATTHQKTEAIQTLKMHIDKLYLHLTNLKYDYDQAQDQSTIDSLITAATELKSEIAMLDNQVDTQWNVLYNRKLDNYLVLSDKVGGVDRNQLEALDQLSRQVLHMQTVGETSLAPNITAYSSQESLLMGYEKLLVDKLKLTAAADSLKTVQLQLKSNSSQSEYPDIQFPYRSLVKYAPITLGNHYPYEDIKDTPQLKLPQKGVYYSVQVALVSGTASSLAIFKGAQPLQVEKTATGQSRYVLGGFKTYDEGISAVKQCYGVGFKNPILVAWVNGLFTTTAKAKAYQAANPGSDNSAYFQIEITSPDPAVAATIKSTLDINSPGKTISRTEQNGQLTYIITRFTTIEEAQVIAQIIKTKEQGLSDIKVLPIE